MFCDNLSSIKLVENSIFHARTKHMGIHYHFIREKVLKGEIQLKNINTTEKVADTFTKSLSDPKVLKFNKKIGLGQLHIEKEC